MWSSVDIVNTICNVLMTIDGAIQVYYAWVTYADQQKVVENSNKTVEANKNIQSINSYLESTHGDIRDTLRITNARNAEIMETMKSIQATNLELVRFIKPSKRK